MKGNMGGPPSEIYNQDEGEPGSPFSETPSTMERGSSERGFLFFYFMIIIGCITWLVGS